MNGRYTKGRISQRIGTSLDIWGMDPAMTAKDDQHTHNIITIESRKRSLSEVHKSISREQVTQEDEFLTAESLFHEASQRLQDAIKIIDMGQITVVQQIFLDVATPKMEAARKNLEACRNKRSC